MPTRELKRCQRCVMLSTWQGITFSPDGVCSVCQEHDKKKDIHWRSRQEYLIKILRTYRNLAKNSGNKYDCILGYSGGKDTAYTLWAAVRKYSMRPLVVTFDHGFKLSDEGEYNLTEIPKKLDCDHLRFTIGSGLRNALCLKGSELIGDFCIHCHLGIGSFPARISKLFGIPLQIWGEPTAEYQTTGDYKLSDIEEQNKEHFEKVFLSGLTSDRILPAEYELLDLQPMTWPQGSFPLKAIYLGNFEPWNQREHVEIITRELGWKSKLSENTYVTWDKVDCPYETIRDWQKWLKRGFGRVTFQASKDIREGRITREEALELIARYEGRRPSNMDSFLSDIGMTEEEFNRLTLAKLVRWR